MRIILCLTFDTYSHADRHIRLGDGVHRWADKRRFQCDLAWKRRWQEDFLSGEVDKARKKNEVAEWDEVKV